MELIAAVDRHWGIGQEDALQFRIRQDHQRFRALTMGQVVVMGRKSLLTLPNGAPLAGRETILFTHDPALHIPGALACHGLEELGSLLQRQEYAGKRIFVIGGAQIYALLAPYCTLAFITHVCAKRPADAFFPRLSRLPGWERADCSGWQETAQGLRYAYATYRNTFPQILPGQA